MTFIAFLAQTIIISLSGVMAPGPITTVTVGAGMRSPHAGALVAIGHGIVEFPLMILIIFGLGHVFSQEYVKVVIFSLGGLFLLAPGKLHPLWYSQFITIFFLVLLSFKGISHSTK